MKERRKILNVAIQVRNYGHSLRRADPLHSSPIFLLFSLFFFSLALNGKQRFAALYRDIGYEWILDAL